MSSGLLLIFVRSVQLRWYTSVLRASLKPLLGSLSRHKPEGGFLLVLVLELPMNDKGARLGSI